MTQPEALRHAAKLDAHEFDEPHGAAAELRRLHAQRDALLEALKQIVNAADGSGWDQLDPSFKKARAAIKAAEENT